MRSLARNIMGAVVVLQLAAPLAAGDALGAQKRLGTFGERVAIAHLEEKGYRIRETNFRVREGEIDIVAEQGDTLVFVEVKTRRGDAMGSAKESIGWRKAQSLLLAAQAYEERHEELPPGRRIDVIAIDLDADGELLSVEHIESAVEET